MPSEPLGDLPSDLPSEPPSDLTSHLLRLPASRWLLWRDCAVRSAGFPVSLTAGLADPAILREAEAAAECDPAPAGYRRAYGEAAARSARALQDVVDDPRFREAVAWQNPAIVRNWLAGLHHCPDQRKLRKSRYLGAVASYAQRYATKNDTIGFFGPVGWARWDESHPDFAAVAGPRLLRSRSLYFEDWAIEALARSLSEQPDLRRWIKPRMVAGCYREGTTVHRPHAPAVALGAEAVPLFRLCTGERSVTQLCQLLGWDEPAVTGQLLAWQELSIMHFDFTGPVEARPEVTLRAKLAGIGEPPARSRALSALTRLEQARDALAAARGDPEGVARRAGELEQVFQELTGLDGHRRPGQTYAGRTLVYEDARRDVDVVLGRQLLESVSGPLSIVLDAAAWLINRAGAELERRLGELFDRYCERSGGHAMPLPTLLARATRLLYPRPGRDSPLAGVQQEFQRRWAQLLAVPAGARQHVVHAKLIAEQAAALFPALPAPWPGAVHICPDLMIAASSPRAVAAGECQFVLGEVHLANNTLQARPFVEHHDDPAALLAALACDYPRPRVYSVPTRRWPQVNSRTYPSALLPPSYVYWCLHDDSGGAAGPVLAAAAMSVHREGADLIVRAGPDGRRFPLTDVLDEQLSWAVVNLFAPLPGTGHQPRVAIDRLVIHRERWAVTLSDLQWTRSTVAAERFRLAQRWRRRQQLPARVFYRTPGETKPCYLDFASPALVECFSNSVRAAVRSARTEPVTVVEMLPDLDQAWLPGPDGQRYTSELRLVCRNRRLRDSPVPAPTTVREEGP